MAPGIGLRHGLFQLIASIAVAQPGWGWVLAQWPVSGLWVIGLFVGIDLIFYGCAWIALALSLRRLLSQRRLRIRFGCWQVPT
jgi:uncharacterized membrane protein HdeD (DUF308 family)